MNRPSILFHRPGAWHSDIESSTKVLCRMFSQSGYPTYYFGHHPDILSLLRHPFRQWRQWRAETPNRGYPVVLRSTCPLPLRDLSGTVMPLSFRLGYRTSMPSLRKLPGLQQGPDIIWAARPGASALKQLYPRARLIMQVVDYYPAFRGQGIHHVEKLDYIAADHVVTIGDALKSYLRDELGVPEVKISVLGQGVHSALYDHPLDRPTDFPQTEGPVAVWVGVLAKCDQELMRAAAEQLNSRGGALLLIGPADRASTEMAREFPCVHLLGSRNPDEVPAYLWHADIGLMLYDRGKAEVYRGQNPLKLYEYAAAGLTILSSPHTEYQYLRPPVDVCYSTHDVTAALARYQSSEDRRQTAQRFARDHDWRHVFDRARHIIHQLENSDGGRYHQPNRTHG